MALHPLLSVQNFDEFSLLVLNNSGRFIEPNKDLENFSDAKIIPTEALPEYMKKNIVLPLDVTDVFVWVHGWRNTARSAVTDARRLFNGIFQGWSKNRVYPRLTNFVPAFIAVHWPSMSSPGPLGYKRIRNRASAMTDDGEAEFFLAALLGYLEWNNPRGSSADSKILRARGGFKVHCIGHSFGGRFLTAAIRAATAPKSPRTLSLISQAGVTTRKVLSTGSNNGFDFTVDSVLVFQMAAPHGSFGPELDLLVKHGPLSGPLVLTHSNYDRANCIWHKLAEFEAGIGCSGASQPASEIGQIRFRDLDCIYTEKDFATRIVNVDATWAFKNAGMRPEGAHSDFWYEESIHLLLSLANSV